MHIVYRAVKHCILGMNRPLNAAEKEVIKTKKQLKTELRNRPAEPNEDPCEIGLWPIKGILKE